MYHADRLWDRVINGTAYRFFSTTERIVVFRNPGRPGDKVHEWYRAGE